MQKSIFRKNNHFFHVNTDFQAHPLFKELDWIFVQKTIQPLLKNHSIQLYAFVMMDTHLHLLIQSEQKKENYFCEDLKKAFSTKTSKIEWHCEPVTSYPQFLSAYKYIYRNPIEAGLARQVEDYPYSSLQSLLGKGVAYLDIVDHMRLIHNPIHHLNWLNNKEAYTFSQLKNFMAHATFKSPTTKSNLY